MITTRLFVDRYVMRYPSIPALGYGALVAALVMTVFVAMIDVLQRHRAIMESAGLLARFEHRTTLPSAGPGRITGNQPQGSPFLDGQTVTTASAALLQRVNDAITRAGGNVVSSEVAPQDSHSADGLLRITATCELEQRALQGLLYDIEAGMPFLFIDQLLAQAPPPESQSGRMRIVLEVSGLWPGTKLK
jgi:general secretion pathway protein M